MKKIWFLIIIIVAALVGTSSYFYIKSLDKNILSIIINKENKDYTDVVLTNYEEYQAFISEYNINGKMTEKEFENKDYIADFIPYVKNLKIINIEVYLDSDLKIVYETDPMVMDSDKLLVNFMPIDKGALPKINSVDKEFK